MGAGFGVEGERYMVDGFRCLRVDSSGFLGLGFWGLGFNVAPLLVSLPAFMRIWTKT